MKTNLIVAFFAILLPFFFMAQIENYSLSNKTPEFKQVIRYYDSISKKKSVFQMDDIRNNRRGN
jgi:hypothetical protein